jgi:hypothetical protein
MKYKIRQDEYNKPAVASGSFHYQVACHAFLDQYHKKRMGVVWFQLGGMQPAYCPVFAAVLLAVWAARQIHLCQSQHM